MANDIVQVSATPPLATSKHNLLTIPLEVFERIAQHAHHQDLIAVRLVSKEIAAHVYRIYVQAHLTDRSFLLYWKPSLDVLLAIWSSDHFGQHLTEVTLCVDEICKPPDQPVPTNVPIPRGLTTFQGELLSGATHRKRINEYQWHKIFKDLELLWYLTTILCHARQRRIGLKITLGLCASARKRAPCWSKFLRQDIGLGLQVKMTDKHFNLIMQALALSGVRLLGLETTRGMPTFLSSPTAEDRVKTLKNTALVFSHLVELKLVV